MQVKLRVIGDSSKVIYNPRAVRTSGGASQFLIGSGEDCYLRCQSESVNPRHCLITLARQTVKAASLSPSPGVFVNGERINGEQPLQTGDRLQLGDIQFEVVLHQIAAASAALGSNDPENSADGEISNWLSDEDEMERRRRAADPNLRQFKVAPQEAGRATAAQKATDESDPQEEDSDKEKTPEKKQPGKLPKPKAAADNSYDAAANALTKQYGGTISRLIKRDQ